MNSAFAGPFNETQDISVIACGSYLPQKVLTNLDLSAMVDTSDEWITTRTGIKHRHIAADNELTSTLGTKALTAALKDGNLMAENIEGIIVATTTPDYIMPSTAVKIQANIGMKHGFAFDMQAVCSGFIYALTTAYSMIYSGVANTIAVVGAEVMSRIVDWSDRNTCVLFGDGAGAVIISCDKKLTSSIRGSILGARIFSDVNGIDALRVDGGVSAGNLSAKIVMHGQEVFRRAVDSMSFAITNLAQELSINIAQVDWLLLHQANIKIMRSVAAKIGLAEGKIISTVDSHANTSAASIPLALCQYKNSGLIKPGQLIAMSAAGAGMTYGSVFMYT